MTDLIFLALTVLGLTVFEVITSIDNAVINADVLATMPPKARRWFMLWGLLIAVFLIRGLLPLLIVWAANPTLGPVGAFTAAFSESALVKQSVQASAPVLLIAGGVFLIFLFFHWLFLEHKHFGLHGERFFQAQGVWFYAVVSVFLSLITWFAVHKDAMMGFGAVVGSTAFFIVHGFKQNAELREKQLLDKNRRDLTAWSKIMYLEVIDATFSVDGVVGAFAFTLSVPLILLGNGIGALVVRQLTANNIERVKKYVYLKNGAMYSVAGLGVIMVLDSFDYHVPQWVSPIVTFAILAFFFGKSRRELLRGSHPAKGEGRL